MAVFDLTMLISSLTVLASVFHRTLASQNEYKLGVLLPYTYDLNWDHPSAKEYASAVTLAVRKVNAHPRLLKGAKLGFLWSNTACNKTKMIQQQQFQIDQGVVGFIGPSCHAHKAVNTAKKNHKAVVSFDCQVNRAWNKEQHSNFACTNPLHSKAASKLIGLIKKRGLKRVNIIYQDGAKWHSFKKYFTHLLKKNNIATGLKRKIQYHVFFSSVPKYLYLLPFESQATIIIAAFDLTREIVYTTQAYFEKNPYSPFDSHQFISTPLDRLSMRMYILRPFKWFFSAYKLTTPRRTNVTIRGFRKLSLISEVPTVETRKFAKFEKLVRKASPRKPWFSKAYEGCLYLEKKCIFDRSYAKVPFEAVYLYDAVFQFAHALHDVLEAQQKPSGVNIIKKLKGRQFIGADGYQHRFDENANVVYNYTVLKLRKDDRNRLSMLPTNDDVSQQ